ALIGFLWYNAYPAQVFIGDTGSLAIGGIIAVFAVIIHKELLLPVLCFVFLVESVSVMLQTRYAKMGNKRGEKWRVFKRAPLHDAFRVKPGQLPSNFKVLLRWPSGCWLESKITTRFWIVTIITAALTTLLVNARHLFYGISFVDAYRKMKTRPYMIFSLTDETYSVLCGCKNEDPQETHRDAWFWISILHQSYWILGSVLGALLGQMLPIDFTGIDFAMTALFVVILLEQIWSDPAYATFPAVCGLIMGLVSLIIFGADKFLLPALIVTVLIVTVKTQTEKKGEDKP
ncbi:MAG: AzlC family ABC transporter permease, partial [Bacteroidaceae bacterium]|nr:AzlC family ABC transporter permease [Bacteroidaceae bacterium]